MNIAKNDVALAKRQENHGAIWRFFHRRENEERTALLNEMKAALAGTGKVSQESAKIEDEPVKGTPDKNLN